MRWQTWFQIARHLLLLGTCIYLLLGVPHIAWWRVRQQPRPKPDPVLEFVDPAKGLKILMFYASPGVVRKGENATICYGVMNAVAVEIDPPVETLRPAFNHCLSVGPAADTRYTLTAKDKGGKTASETFVIRVAR